MVCYKNSGNFPSISTVNVHVFFIFQGTAIGEQPQHCTSGRRSPLAGHAPSHCHKESIGKVTQKLTHKN